MENKLLKNKLFLAVVLLAAAVLGAARESARAQEVKKVKHGYVAEPGYYWDVFQAQTNGYFKAEGLDVESTRFDVTSQTVTALVTGAVNIVSVTPDVAMLATIKGQGDVVIVSNEVRLPTWDLLVQPDIKTYADLKGKVLGVSQLQSASTLNLRQLLRKNGLKDNEYNILQVGGSSKRYAALQSKQIAATLITEPVNFEAMDAGYRKLGGVYEASVVPSVVYAVTRSWARTNDKVLVALLRAVYKAQDFINNTKNKKEAVDLMVDLSKAQRTSVEKTYDKYVADLKVYNRGDINADVIKKTLEDMVEIEAISKPIPDPNKMLDLSFRQKALAK
ncbi:MAG TPA: ABC transporter substrate-binding protein [Candidatus Binatia bacterium]|jgi:ABC-type nitrate/sulfonate/bicarbonate transport system substrate-binding protein